MGRLPSAAYLLQGGGQALEVFQNSGIRCVVYAQARGSLAEREFVQREVRTEHSGHGVSENLFARSSVSLALAHMVGERGGHTESYRVLGYA